MQKLNIAIYIIFIILTNLMTSFLIYNNNMFLVCGFISIVALHQILLSEYIKFKKILLTKDVYKYIFIQSLKIALVDCIILSTLFAIGFSSSDGEEDAFIRISIVILFFIGVIKAFFIYKPLFKKNNINLNKWQLILFSIITFVIAHSLNWIISAITISIIIRR